MPPASKPRCSFAAIFLLALGLIQVAATPTAQAAERQTVTVTDLAGRKVEVTVPAKTMILGEGRFLPVLAILDPSDPTKRIAGMMADFKRFDAAGFAQYTAKFPGIETIPMIGHASAESFSLEKSISVKPDVAIFGLGSGHGPGARHKAIIERLKAAGVPVVVVDFRFEPLINTPKSLELLGRIMGREKEAKAFNDFYAAELDRVRKGLAGLKDADRPKVFLEIHVGGRDDCCATMSHAMMGRFIELAGGDNIAMKTIPGAHGLLSMEYLLATQPDIYMGTAIGAAGVDYPKPGRIVLGPGSRASSVRPREPEYAAASLAQRHPSRSDGAIGAFAVVRGGISVGNTSFEFGKAKTFQEDL